MKCYRITDALHRADILAGKSAALTGGRWNPRGQEAIYGSTTISLAILELRCHYGRSLLGNELVVATIEVPDDTIHPVDPAHLPERWMALETFTQHLGASLMASGVMALEVPSIAHAFERNIVLNPQHPDFSRVTLHAVEKLTVSPRLHTSGDRSE